MNYKHYIGKNVKNVTIDAKQLPISKVILNGDNNMIYIAGDDSGQVIETYVPTANQQMAVDILNRVRGFRYQGYVANGAFIPPTAELGDGITVGGIYGILASREYSFTPKMTENISAPYEPEEDHEYNYQGNYAYEINNKVQQGQLYYGTRISKQNGLEIIKTDENIKKSRVILNSDIIAFYNDNGQEAFYFDSNAGVFRLSQYVNVEDALNESQAFSQLELTAQQLQIQINDAKGNISSLQLTAGSLQTQINNNKGDISSLQLTAQQLQIQITNNDNEISEIEQYAKSIRLSVSNGYDSSTITLTAGNATISSDSINFTGVATFQDLEGEGTTKINGKNIITGSISANQLNLSGAIYFKDFSDELQGTINDIDTTADFARQDAINAVEDVWSLADGELESGTFIDRKSIFSPEIYAQEFNIIAESNVGGFYLYGYFGGNDVDTNCRLAIEYYSGDYPNTVIFSPSGELTLVPSYIGQNISDPIEITGNIIFTGTVDFTNAVVNP